MGLNLVEFEMDPQQALDAPRFQWTQDKEFGVEDSFSDEVYANLVARGHVLLPRATPMAYGGGQAIVRDPESGVLVAGSEPRNDGTAVGW